MADGGLLEKRAEEQHLLGEQWGMMNETGSYPGQAWLWLYALWYQVEPFKSSENADILVMLDDGCAEPRVHLHPVHPRDQPAPAQDPDLQADLERALPRTAGRVASRGSAGVLAAGVDQPALERVVDELGASGEPELLLDV